MRKNAWSKYVSEVRGRSNRNEQFEVAMGIVGRVIIDVSDET